MELLTQIGLGVSLLIATVVLSWFFYTAIKSPEEMRPGLASPLPLPDGWGDRLYLAIVVLSWLAFAFSGAYGLLRWLPFDLSVTFAGGVALVSLGLLTHLERSAYVLNGYRRTLKVRKELEQLVKYATIPSQGTIEGFQEKAKSAETLADRDAYLELARIAAALAARDTELCEYAVSQAQREAAEQAEAKAKADAIAKAQVAKRELHDKLRSVLNAVAPSLPSRKTLDYDGGGEVLLEAAVAKQKWKSLYDFGERLHRLGEDAPILTLLQDVAGIHPTPDTSFEIAYEGNSHGGYFDVSSIRQGGRAALADGLVFETSLDGLMAAFFFRAALPGRLAWWHGLYGRDQMFIFNQDQMVSILENDRVSPDSDGLRAVSVPPGIRFAREDDGTLTMRCLIYRPGMGFFDFSVSVTDGVASPVQESKLFQWGQGVYY